MKHPKILLMTLCLLLISGCGKSTPNANPEDHNSKPKIDNIDSGEEVSELAEVDLLCELPTEQKWNAAVDTCGMTQLSTKNVQNEFQRIKAWSKFTGYWPRAILKFQSFRGKHPGTSGSQWDCVAQILCKQKKGEPTPKKRTRSQAAS